MRRVDGVPLRGCSDRWDLWCDDCRRKIRENVDPWQLDATGRMDLCAECERKKRKAVRQ